MQPYRPRNVLAIGMLGCFIVPFLFGLLIVGFYEPAVQPEAFMVLLLVVPLFLMVFGLPVILAMTWMAYRASKMSRQQEKNYMLRNLCFCLVILLVSVAVFLAESEKPPTSILNFAILCGSWFSGYVTASLGVVLFIRTSTLFIQSHRQNRG